MEKYVLGEDTLVLSSPSEYVLESELIGKKKIIVRNSFEEYNFYLQYRKRNRNATMLSDLEEIRVEGEGNFRSSDDGKMLFRCSKNGNMDLVYAICREENVVIPDNVRWISEYAFAKSGIRSVKFPKTLESIGDEAFSGCSQLESVDLNGVTEIGSSAFYGCKSLRKVELHEGLTEISNSAFCDCPKLEKIDIPSSVKELGTSSLGSVKDVYLMGEFFPRGILAAADTRDNSSSVNVHIGNSQVIIPRIRDFSKCDLAEQYLKESDLKKGKTIVLYQIAAHPEDRQDIALQWYSQAEDPKMKKFLRRKFPDMLRRTKTEEEFLELFHKFRDVGLLTKGLAQKALEVAQKEEWIRASANVLDFLNEHAKKYSYECVDKFQL